jgi:hypothetical protein
MNGVSSFSRQGSMTCVFIANGSQGTAMNGALKNGLVVLVGVVVFYVGLQGRPVSD